MSLDKSMDTIFVLEARLESKNKEIQYHKEVYNQLNESYESIRKVLHESLDECTELKKEIQCHKDAYDKLNDAYEGINQSWRNSVEDVRALQLVSDENAEECERWRKSRDVVKSMLEGLKVSYEKVVAERDALPRNRESSSHYKELVAKKEECETLSATLHRVVGERDGLKEANKNQTKRYWAERERYEEMRKAYEEKLAIKENLDGECERWRDAYETTRKSLNQRLEELIKIKLEAAQNAEECEKWREECEQWRNARGLMRKVYDGVTGAYEKLGGEGDGLKALNAEIKKYQEWRKDHEEMKDMYDNLKTAYHKMRAAYFRISGAKNQ